MSTFPNPEIPGWFLDLNEIKYLIRRTESFIEDMGSDEELEALLARLQALYKAHVSTTYEMKDGELVANPIRLN